MANKIEPLIDKILERIAVGDSLREISKDLKIDFSAASKILRSEDINPRYARARELQADYLADEVVQIADAATNETFQSDRLRIDARKWKAGKMRPKNWGDNEKHELNIPGGIEIKWADK